MKYDTYKVFSSCILWRENKQEEELLKIICKYSLECTSNHILFYFEIVENPTGHEEGLGYLTDYEIKKMTDWLIDNGGKIGDTVIIDNDW